MTEWGSIGESIPDFVAGALLLALERNLFWLFVGIAGFYVGIAGFGRRPAGIFDQHAGIDASPLLLVRRESAHGNPARPCGLPSDGILAVLGDNGSSATKPSIGVRGDGAHAGKSNRQRPAQLQLRRHKARLRMPAKATQAA